MNHLMLPKKLKLSHRKSESVMRQLLHNLWLMNFLQKGKTSTENFCFLEKSLQGFEHCVCEFSFFHNFISSRLMVNSAKWLRLSLAGWKFKKRWSWMQKVRTQIVNLPLSRVLFMINGLCKKGKDYRTLAVITSS